MRSFLYKFRSTCSLALIVLAANCTSEVIAQQASAVPHQATMLPLSWGNGVIFNVARPPFNASGDGVADDTIAIQSAIDTAHAEGGVVFVPAGTYRVTSTLHLKSRVRLIGAGRNHSVILGSSVPAHILEVQNQSDVAVSDLTVDAGGNQGAGHGIRGASVRGVVISRVNVRNTAEYGIGFQNGTIADVNIVDVRVSDSGTDGIDIKNRANNNDNVSLHKVTVDRPGQGFSGVDIRGRAELTNITVNLVHEDSVGIRFRPPSSGGLGANRSYVDGFLVSSTTGMGTIGVEVQDNDIRVVNGRVDGVGFGVRVLGDSFSSFYAHVKNVLIRGCHISRSGTGIFSYAPQLVVSDVIIRDVSQGVFLQSLSRSASLLSNVLVDNTNGGIAFHVVDTNDAAGLGTDDVSFVNCSAQNASQGWRITADRASLRGCRADGGWRGIRVLSNGGMTPHQVSIVGCFSGNNTSIDIENNGGTSAQLLNNTTY